MDDLEKSSQLLKEALEEMRRSTVLSTATLNKLNAAVNNNSKAINQNTEEQASAAKTAADVTASLRKVVSATIESSNSIRENREDFRSLNPAIRATGAAAGMLGKKFGGLLEGVGDAAFAISTFAKHPALRVGGFILGGALSGIGKYMGAASDEAAKLAVQFGEFATNELQNVVESTRMLGSVGAIGAGGMTQLIDRANAAGMGLKEFANLIQNNSRALALAAGTTEKGAKAVSDVGAAFKDSGFEREFAALGISFNEQRDFIAQFMKQNRLIGQININDTRALTEASRAYITQLDELSRLTGMQRQDVAKALDDQLRNVRFFATLAKAEAEGGELRRKAIQNVGLVLAEKGSKELAEGFQDAFGGLNTEMARAFELATGGEGKAIIERLRSGQIDEAQALEQLQAAIKKTTQGLGGMEFFERLGKTGTVFDNMALGMAKITNEQNLTVAALRENKDTQNAATKAQEGTNGQIIDAQVALRNVAVQLDNIVKERILPKAADAVKGFTKQVEAFVTYAEEKLGLPKSGAGAQPAGAPPAAGPGAQPPRAPGATSSGAAQLRGAAAKNLNPGNLKFIGQEGATMGTGGFARFESVDQGLVALAKDLNAKLTGRSRHGQLDTLETLISKYAPPNENDTRAYINKMSAFMGISPNTKLNSDPKTLAKLMTGIIGIENHGVPNKGYDFRNGVQFGVAQALNIDPGDIGQFRYGGISSGPKSGYMSMLHGTEAVVPLPGGRSIPVEMTGMTDKINEQVSMMGSQVDRLDTLINLMQESVGVSKNILRATTS